MKTSVSMLELQDTTTEHSAGLLEQKQTTTASETSNQSNVLVKYA